MWPLLGEDVRVGDGDVGFVHDGVSGEGEVHVFFEVLEFDVVFVFPWVGGFVAFVGDDGFDFVFAVFGGGGEAAADEFVVVFVFGGGEDGGWPSFEDDGGGAEFLFVGAVGELVFDFWFVVAEDGFEGVEGVDFGGVEEEDEFVVEVDEVGGVGELIVPLLGGGVVFVGGGVVVALGFLGGVDGLSGGAVDEDAVLVDEGFFAESAEVVDVVLVEVLECVDADPCFAGGWWSSEEEVDGVDGVFADAGDENDAFGGVVVFDGVGEVGHEALVEVWVAFELVDGVVSGGGHGVTVSVR